jgi:hypothetical protein
MPEVVQLPYSVFDESTVQRCKFQGRSGKVLLLYGFTWWHCTGFFQIISGFFYDRWWIGRVTFQVFVKVSVHYMVCPSALLSFFLIPRPLQSLEMYKPVSRMRLRVFVETESKRSVKIATLVYNAMSYKKNNAERNFFWSSHQTFMQIGSVDRIISCSLFTGIKINSHWDQADLYMDH